MKIFEIIFHILMIIIMILIIFFILTKAGEQMWILQQLKNKCIADCVAFNKDAIANGIVERCVC